MGNIHYLGFNLLPERFIDYAWIPLVISAPLGLNKFREYLKYFNNKQIKIFFIMIILFSTSIHAINFQINITDGSLFSIPNKQDFEAMKWLENNSPQDATILTIHYWPNVDTKWIPLISKRNTTYLRTPITSNINLDSVDIPETNGIVGKIIEPFVTYEQKQIQIERAKKFKEYRIEPYIMLKYPDSEESKYLMNSYNIKYIYTWDNTYLDKLFSESKSFILVYQNEEVKIYERI